MVDDMKNDIKRRILPLLLLAAVTLVSCGESGGAAAPSGGGAGAQTAADDAVVTEAPETEAGRAGTADSLPSDVDLGGMTLRVIARMGDEDTRIEFFADQLDGEVVNDAVYTRNMKVEERLNCKMELIGDGNTCHGGFADTVNRSVQAGSDDFDLVANAMYNSMPIVLKGCFTDLNSLRYLDFGQPWWNRAFLDITEYNGKNYAAIGELAQTMISGAFVMFFDRTSFEELFPGEPSLYATVEDGGWTVDKLISYCEPVYSDLNGDGEANEGDRFGHFFTNTKTLGCDSFVGGCNINLMKKNDDGSYEYTGSSERTLRFIDKMHRLLFENNNTLRTPDNNDTIMKSMVNRQTIFTTWMLSGVNYLRDMENDFGIIPMPKLDENQADYNVFTHDGCSAFSIPITCGATDETAALLEALSAETYRTVTPAYFETALKGKYSRDSETARMLDIIVAGVYLDITYIYGQNLGTPIDMMRGILGGQSACEKAASTLAKKESSILKSMDKIIAAYEGLG